MLCFCLLKQDLGILRYWPGEPAVVNVCTHANFSVRVLSLLDVFESRRRISKVKRSVWFIEISVKIIKSNH